MPPDPAAAPKLFSRVGLRRLLTRTFQNWGADQVPRLAAAFSFYAVLSLAPTLVLAVVVAGAIYGEGAARQHLLDQARSVLGSQGSEFIGELIDNAKRPGASLVATLISLGITFFSSSNLFIALQETVNIMWGIERKDPIVRGFLLARVSAFVGVLSFGVLVISWLTFDAWIAWLERATPGFRGAQLSSFLASFLFLTLVFAFALRHLPRNRLATADVWPGAIVTAVGMSLTKYLLGLYFGLANISAAYGSAGVLVVILLWIYYTSQIFFFGVELTYAYAHEIGSLRGTDHRRLKYS